MAASHPSWHTSNRPITSPRPSVEREEIDDSTLCATYTSTCPSCPAFLPVIPHVCLSLCPLHLQASDPTSCFHWGRLCVHSPFGKCGACKPPILCLRLRWFLPPHVLKLVPLRRAIGSVLQRLPTERHPPVVRSPLRTPHLLSLGTVKGSRPPVIGPATQTSIHVYNIEDVVSVRILFTILWLVGQRWRLLFCLLWCRATSERQTECFQPLWSQSEVRDQHRLRIAANGKSVEGIGKVTCNGNSGSGCRSSFWGYAHNNRRGQSATSGILHTVTKPCKHRQTGCFKGACPVSEQPNQRDRDNLSTCRVSCCSFKLQFEVQKPAFHSQQPLASHPMLQKQSSSKLGLEAVHVHPDGLLADFAGTFFCEPKAGQGWRKTSLSKEKGFIWSH